MPTQLILMVCETMYTNFVANKMIVSFLALDGSQHAHDYVVRMDVKKKQRAAAVEVVLWRLGPVD
jgi:hypothetical protein